MVSTCGGGSGGLYLLVEQEGYTMWRSEWVWLSQHEGNLMKLAGCHLVEVQWTLLQYSLLSFFKTTLE